jgi:hypothetical protein
MPTCMPYQRSERLLEAPTTLSEALAAVLAAWLFAAGNVAYGASAPAPDSATGAEKCEDHVDVESGPVDASRTRSVWHHVKIVYVTRGTTGKCDRTTVTGDLAESDSPSGVP